MCTNQWENKPPHLSISLIPGARPCQTKKEVQENMSIASRSIFLFEISVHLQTSKKKEIIKYEHLLGLLVCKLLHHLPPKLFGK
jgi:hypothetical protein